jgi:uncharacterized protein YbdZ (MbtH family)
MRTAEWVRPWPGHQFFRVVTNGVGQHSFWPLEGIVPAGWKATGFVGTRQATLECVAEAWPGLRSPRRPGLQRGPLRGEPDPGGLDLGGLDLVELVTAAGSRQPDALAVSAGPDRLTYRELADAVAVAVSAGPDRLASGEPAGAVAAGRQEPEQAGAARGAGVSGALGWRAGLVGVGMVIAALAGVRGGAAEVGLEVPDPAGRGRLTVAVDERRLLAAATDPALPFRPGDRVALLAGPRTGLARLGLWWSVAGGAELLLAPDPLALLGAGAVTAAVADDDGVRAALADPSLLAGLRALRVPATLPERAYDALLAAAPAALSTVYGAAETSGVLAFNSAPRDGEARSLGVPVGEAELHVLDEDLRPVQRGQSGWLFVAGPVLAHGYGDRPDLTAEAFLPDPVGADGGRLFATWDRARRRPDGRLELLGPYHR